MQSRQNYMTTRSPRRYENFYHDRDSHRSPRYNNGIRHRTDNTAGYGGSGYKNFDYEPGIRGNHRNSDYERLYRNYENDIGSGNQGGMGGMGSQGGMGGNRGGMGGSQGGMGGSQGSQGGMGGSQGGMGGMGGMDVSQGGMGRHSGMGGMDDNDWMGNRWDQDKNTTNFEYEGGRYSRSGRNRSGSRGRESRGFAALDPEERREMGRRGAEARWGL
jgi:hypothetical protein